jgi:hypothetical protein
MRPYHAFAKVHTVDEAAVESKGIEVNPPGTGTKDEGVDPFVSDVLLDDIDSPVTAENGMLLYRQPLLFCNTL